MDVSRREVSRETRRSLGRTKRLFVRGLDIDQFGRREIQFFQSRYRAQGLVLSQQQAKRRRHVAEGSHGAAEPVAERGGGDREPHCRAEQPKRNQNTYCVAIGVGLRIGLHHDRQGREQGTKPDRHHGLETNYPSKARVRSPQRTETET
ncbi:hypothetical protein CRV24_010571 [Beauveria bassiana]|nr:hypothetical protein CRV24_010571 [Beauveria bassiana]